jgi:hypothetical protein
MATAKHDCKGLGCYYHKGINYYKGIITTRVIITQG